MEVSKKKLLEQIQQAKHGKQTAFNFLLDRYWNEVYGFQLARINNEFEAEEITIETFAKAFDKIHTFKEEYTFSTWLIAISKNLHIDKIRKTKSGIQIQNSEAIQEQVQKIADDSPSPEDNLITQQNLAELLRFIKMLKPHYQDVINLRYFQEMSYKEISEMLDEPINNVKVKLLRSKKLLAEIISKNRQ
ncbi:RNA polymerase sigma factor [Planktosalinus lacus]|uniref:DNA-directed RNA polymerase sigma-70 factor n=1 Tax=Planktosalinus lacus TaxID=1526573 RepID=A0A8J2Y9N3_9FLAO|nr:sigma-70 family RNA polymerase sigma factor [Planktosalinus lacus]GGD87582.1 DNA-directed RNA polymerase sigma-70 factor [Planktosalinus lacus]